MKAKHRANKATQAVFEVLAMKEAHLCCDFANRIVLAEGISVTVGNGSAMFANDNSEPIRKIIKGNVFELASQIKELI